MGTDEEYDGLDTWIKGCRIRDISAIIFDHFPGTVQRGI